MESFERRSGILSEGDLETHPTLAQHVSLSARRVPHGTDDGAVYVDQRLSGACSGYDGQREELIVL